MTEKRYDWDIHVIWDYENESDEYLESYEDITNLLNKKDKRIKELEQSIENKFKSDEYWEKKAKQKIMELEMKIAMLEQIQPQKLPESVNVILKKDED